MTKKHKRRSNGAMNAMAAINQLRIDLASLRSDVTDEINHQREFIGKQLSQTRQQFTSELSKLGSIAVQAKAHAIDAKSTSVKSRILVIEFAEKCLAMLNEIRKAEE